MQSQPIITRHALRSQRGRKKHRILLAEDNAVNQKVACRTLENLGYRVDVAADGQAAVEAWKTGRYDLILMDCQMPVLDGYEATREIRRLEEGRKRIPIIALTAHAMKGADLECTAAGMDDYLTKPIDRAQLEARLERHLAGDGAIRTDSSLATATMTTLEAEGPPVDWHRLLQASDGDASFAKELIDLFVECAPEAVGAMIAALQVNDFVALAEKAHELKGSSASLQAIAANLAAARLEAAARAGDVDQVPELANDLVNEINRAVDYLRARHKKTSLPS